MNDNSFYDVLALDHVGPKIFVGQVLVLMRQTHLVSIMEINLFSACYLAVQ